MSASPGEIGLSIGDLADNRRSGRTHPSGCIWLEDVHAVHGQPEGVFKGKAPMGLPSAAYRGGRPPGLPVALAKEKFHGYVENRRAGPTRGRAPRGGAA